MINKYKQWIWAIGQPRQACLCSVLFSFTRSVFFGPPIIFSHTTAVLYLMIHVCMYFFVSCRFSCIGVWPKSPHHNMAHLLPLFRPLIQFQYENDTLFLHPRKSRMQMMQGGAIYTLGQYIVHMVGVYSICNIFCVSVLCFQSPLLHRKGNTHHSIANNYSSQYGHVHQSVCSQTAGSQIMDAGKTRRFLRAKIPAA